jgi:hypothetical protein
MINSVSFGEKIMYQSSTLSQHALYPHVFDIKKAYDAQCGKNNSDNSVLVPLNDPNGLATWGLLTGDDAKLNRATFKSDKTFSDNKSVFNANREFMKGAPTITLDA